MTGIRIGCFLAGILLLAFAGKAAPLLDRVMVRLIPAGKQEQNEKEEDDILNNKIRWRVILTGFIILGIVAAVSLISVFTLNNKINTLYNSVQSLEEKVEELSSGEKYASHTEQP